MGLGARVREFAGWRARDWGGGDKSYSVSAEEIGIPEHYDISFGCHKGVMG